MAVSVWCEGAVRGTCSELVSAGYPELVGTTVMQCGVPAAATRACRCASTSGVGLESQTGSFTARGQITLSCSIICKRA